MCQGKPLSVIELFYGLFHMDIPKTPRNSLRKPQDIEMYALYYAPRFIKEYWQAKRLRQLIKHATRNIPLYRDLLASKKIDVRRVRKPTDLRLLPIITKETFSGSSVDMFVDNSRTMNQVWSSTSGTSGKPFSFIPGLSGDLTYSDFISFRFLLSYGWYPWEISEIKIARIKMHRDNRENRFFVSVQEFFSDPDASIVRIAEFKPLVLEGFPSVLLELVRRVEANPSLPKIAPRFAVVMGEVLTVAARERISKALGCEVYNRYSTEEMGTLGMECGQHDGFHLINDVVLVEVTDDTGAPAAPGEQGKILLTDLSNFNMPLIRYDVGDSGFIIKDACACGQLAPRIKIAGRHSASLSFGARRIFHLECAAIFEAFSGIVLQYQVVKRSDSELLLRLVTSRELTEAETLDITKAFHAIAGEIRVVPERVKLIESSPTGKSQTIVDMSAV
jgi:phenylacetate-CoA ligase